MNSDEALAAIREILYPKGDMDAEWSSDELPLIADVVRSVGRVDDEPVYKGGSYCEDYPCCGHTAEDPCRRQWYDHPDAFNPHVNPHALCEHEYGICEVEPEEVDPEDCQHSSVSSYTRKPWGTWYECSYCESLMEPVTDIDQHFFESRVVPGMWLDIPVLVINYRVKP